MAVLNNVTDSNIINKEAASVQETKQETKAAVPHLTDRAAAKVYLKKRLQNKGTR